MHSWRRDVHAVCFEHESLGNRIHTWKIKYSQNSEFCIFLNSVTLESILSCTCGCCRCSICCCSLYSFVGHHTCCKFLLGFLKTSTSCAVQAMHLKKGRKGRERERHTQGLGIYKLSTSSICKQRNRKQQEEKFSASNWRGILIYKIVS